MLYRVRPIRSDIYHPTVEGWIVRALNKDMAELYVRRLVDMSCIQDYDLVVDEIVFEGKIISL